MAAEQIDGKKLAAEMRAQIAAGVAALKAEKGVTPGLAVILVGDNPASVSYVTAKEKACREAGMLSREVRLPAALEKMQTSTAKTAIKSTTAMATMTPVSIGQGSFQTINSDFRCEQ